jgi:hypothetical protein
MIKVAFEAGAQAALRDFGLLSKHSADLSKDKLAAVPVPGPSLLSRFKLPGMLRARGPGANFYEGLHEGGLSGLGYAGDLGLLAVATTPLLKKDDSLF